ncbi:MAG: hypothetical protein EZS28_042345, partial [Streblomastix strix]
TSRKDRGIPHGLRVDQGRKLLTEFLDNINMIKETLKMIIDGQKLNTQKKYMQTMGVFDDWMKEKNHTIQDIMNQKIPFKHTEFMTWLTRTRKTKPSSAKHHVSILKKLINIPVACVVSLYTVVETCTVPNMRESIVLGINAWCFAEDGFVFLVLINQVMNSVFIFPVRLLLRVESLDFSGGGISLLFFIFFHGFRTRELFA